MLKEKKFMMVYLPLKYNYFNPLVLFDATIKRHLKAREIDKEKLTLDVLKNDIAEILSCISANKIKEYFDKYADGHCIRYKNPEIFLV